MKYYVITKEQAEMLALTEQRYGSPTDGYLVNIGDLAAYGMERAVSEGAQELTHEEAREFVKHHK